MLFRSIRVGSLAYKAPIVHDLDFITLKPLKLAEKEIIEKLGDGVLLRGRKGQGRQASIQIDVAGKPIQIDVWHAKAHELPYFIFMLSYPKGFQIHYRNGLKNKGYQINQYGVRSGSKPVEYFTDLDGKERRFNNNKDFFLFAQAKGLDFPYRSPHNQYLYENKVISRDQAISDSVGGVLQDGDESELAYFGNPHYPMFKPGEDPTRDIFLDRDDVIYTPEQRERIQQYMAMPSRDHQEIRNRLEENLPHYKSGGFLFEDTSVQEQKSLVDERGNQLEYWKDWVNNVPPNNWQNDELIKEKMMRAGCMDCAERGGILVGDGLVGGDRIEDQIAYRQHFMNLHGGIVEGDQPPDFFFRSSKIPRNYRQ